MATGVMARSKTRGSRQSPANFRSQGSGFKRGGLAFTPLAFCMHASIWLQFRDFLVGGALYLAIEPKRASKEAASMAPGMREPSAKTSSGVPWTLFF